MTRMQKFAGLILCGSLSWAPPVLADAVTDWNAIADPSVAAGRPGPVGALDLALVQAAVHDAVQAIDRRFEPYYAEVPGAKGRRSAAVAAAAHGVLVGFYPTQKVALDIVYFNYLADKGLGGDPGLAVGQQVAAAYLPLRRPTPVLPPFVGPINPGPGEWRPTPPAFAPMAFEFLVNTNPLTLTGPGRFRAVPPPALTSERYRRDYNEVKALGAQVGSSRTAEQTDIAHFWSGNPVAVFNQGLRAIAGQHVHKTGDTARLFALANLAVADALITSWDSKRFYNFWRPVTAIQLGDNDTNPNTVGDPAWLSLLSTPPYPDYTSGANSVSGAMTGALAHFFGRDRMTFELTTVAPLAVKKTRTYHRFSEAAQEVVDARIYLGFHFRFADTAARKHARQVAKWIHDHFLLPVDNGHHGDKNKHHNDDD